MNIDNDYDNDGNNIVPCPICLDVYCPSKENGKCPEEDMFALEGEIRMLLDEYKATDDNSRIANVLEAVEKILHQQLQKAREEERERVKRFLSLREASPQTDFDSDEEYQLHRQKIGAINWYANLIKGQIDLPDLPETNY